MQRTGESDAGRPRAWLRVLKMAAIVLACGLAAPSAGAQQPGKPGTPGKPAAGAPAPPAGRTRPPAPPAPALHPNLPAATKAAQLELHAGDLLRAGYPLEGARAYEQAAGFTPKESNLWGSAGWAYLDAGQAAAALAAFRQEQALLPAVIAAARPSSCVSCPASYSERFGRLFRVPSHTTARRDFTSAPESLSVSSDSFL